jgi:hypothetical protein
LWLLALDDKNPRTPLLVIANGSDCIAARSVIFYFTSHARPLRCVYMSIYIYVYIYVYVCVRARACVYIYIYINTSKVCMKYSM